MKTSAFNVLASTAAFFALCVPAMACDEDCSVTYSASVEQSDAGDDLPEPITPPVAPVNPLTPAKIAELKARAALVKAAAARAASQKAAIQAVSALKQQQSHVSVVSSTSTSTTSTSNPSDSSDIPTARVRVVPAGTANSNPVTKSHLTVVSTKETTPPIPVAPPKPVVKPKTVVVTPPPAKEETKVSDAVKGLAGDWMATTRTDAGELSTVELQMNDHGVAKLTMPGADGKRSTSSHTVELKDNQLTLKGGERNISLGKVVSVDRRQMVLELATGPMTFVRATAVN